MKKIIKIIPICVILSFLQISCTEPFEIKTFDFTDVLVVESSITNEVKKQVVKLTRTSALEGKDIIYENNADVIVEASNGEVFTFSQDSTKAYVSDKAFKAMPGTMYTLTIRTSDGNQYKSETVETPQTVAIERVYPEVIATNGKEEVQVLVDSYDKTGKAKYFRYEYEETYKVQPPYPSSYITTIKNYDSIALTFDIDYKLRVWDKVCYSKTKYSKGINQTATSELNENRVYRFPVRKIDKNSIMIKERYSILVKQYIQSLEAYTFYKKMKELGSVEGLLTQSQPGYLPGNINSKNNPDEKVLGYFEISPVSMKRIFFDHLELNIEEPDFIADCVKVVPEKRLQIISLLNSGFQVIEITMTGDPIFMQELCTVCTDISTETKPDFWKD
ncbi:DUF4249 domain-containing protein [Aquimarina hainanensis]|uniref:DUF4249 domain-containing protein n=1 Tax=Aquimarina hainanensis TaxID=1578017 RepID=A0ABW5NBF3_9FLAO